GPGRARRGRLARRLLRGQALRGAVLVLDGAPPGRGARGALPLGRGLVREDAAGVVLRRGSEAPRAARAPRGTALAAVARPRVEHPPAALRCARPFDRSAARARPFDRSAARA